MTEDEAAIRAYTTKEVDFRFRGCGLHLHLSHALFSSADIDSGTRFLLKELSRHWDESGLPSSGASGKVQVLDAGSGVGVIGIAVQKALEAQGIPAETRSQDRDELARAFTAANAALNGLGPDLLTARAEGLLSGCQDGAWELILSNLPAKAGNAVLEAFFARAARLLSPSGLLATVIVNPLAGPARLWIEGASLNLASSKEGSDHTVFLCTRAASTLPEDRGSAAELEASYHRGTSTYTIEGTVYEIEALHGLASFDSVSHSTALAARLLSKLSESGKTKGISGKPVLLHEDDQGHLASALAARMREGSLTPSGITLAGRNAVSLVAGERNARRAWAATCLSAVAISDLAFLPAAVKTRYGLILSLPEKVPRIDRTDDVWEAVSTLLVPGGIFIVAMESTEAERFDRRKVKGMSRLGDIKKNGFRALAYLQEQGPEPEPRSTSR